MYHRRKIEIHIECLKQVMSTIMVKKGNMLFTNCFRKQVIMEFVGVHHKLRLEVIF